MDVFPHMNPIQQSLPTHLMFVTSQQYFVTLEYSFMEQRITLHAPLVGGPCLDLTNARQTSVTRVHPSGSQVQW